MPSSSVPSSLDPTSLATTTEQESSDPTSLSSSVPSSAPATTLGPSSKSSQSQSTAKEGGKASSKGGRESDDRSRRTPRDSSKILDDRSGATSKGRSKHGSSKHRDRDHESQGRSSSKRPSSSHNGRGKSSKKSNAAAPDKTHNPGFSSGGYESIQSYDSRTGLKPSNHQSNDGKPRIRDPSEEEPLDSYRSDASKTPLKKNRRR